MIFITKFVFFFSLCSWTVSKTQEQAVSVLISPFTAPPNPKPTSTEIKLWDIVRLMVNGLENFKTCISSTSNLDFYHFYHGFFISFVLCGHRSIRFHFRKEWLSVFCNLIFIVLIAIQYTWCVQHNLHRNIHYIAYLSLLSFQNTTFIMHPTAQLFRIWQYFHYETLLWEDFLILP